MAKDDPYLGEVIYDGGSAFMEFVRGPEFTAYLESKYPTIAPARDGSSAGTERPQFAVYRDGAGTYNTAGQTIEWNYVAVNEGGVWDRTKNAFKAPVDGNYFLESSLLNSQDGGFYADIVVNGTTLPFGTYARGYSPSQYVSAVSPSILKLTAGDTVWLKVAVGTCHNYHCAWTGFLIPKEN